MLRKFAIIALMLAVVWVIQTEERESSDLPIPCGSC